ncbi:hypothetical protein [Kineosporia sp. NBRC 101731]|uniref:hypothetical protein n=1 Tax=Kineosporia sp. NBRC 101731 TaxID=3032199 RepID=UPI0024A17C6F|nr:hypothetical protein [Kineosporia sp. NBRC 101731]GLY33103.1 hypothetical protein Kisp02_64680 [Kineosporia sp. NBRC 101731]
MNLLLPDFGTLSDVRTFVGRSRQVDDGGAIRLVAQGQVLAMYAGALHGAGGPTVLALRVLTLAEPAQIDATVPLAAMADRFARIDRLLAGARPTPRSVGRPIELPVPPTTATNASWAGMAPPRSGWNVEGVVPFDLLRGAARTGIDEVAAGVPAGSGAAAVAKLRGIIWGRPLLADASGGSVGLPTGAAFAAETFGFLGRGSSDPEQPDQDVATLHSAGRWWRLSTTRGHVLARPASGI